MSEHVLSILVKALGINTASKEIQAFESGIGKVGTVAGKGEAALSHFAGRVTGVATALGVAGLAGGFVGVAGAMEEGIKKASDWGLSIEKLGGLTSNTAEQLSGLLGITEKYGISNERIAQIVGFTEKTLGKLEVATAKSGKAAKSAALQHLELVKAQRIANGESTTTINKLIAEQKARDELTASMSNAVDGTTKLAAMQAQYGVQLTDSKGKALDFQSVLLNVADAYSKATTASQKAKDAALAAAVFGRGYADLLPILKLGRQGILDAEDAAKQLGLTLSQQNVADLAKFREASREAGDAVSGLELQLGLLVVPDLTDDLKHFTDFMRTHREDVQKFFHDGLKVAEGIAAFVTGTLIPAVQTVAGVFTTAWSAIPKPLQDMLTTGLIADRTVKFLFGFSPAHMIVDGLETGVSKGLGSILGHFIGKGVVQPVFVTNPGGLGGLPGPAGAPEGGLLGALKVAGAAAVGAGVLIGTDLALAHIAEANIGVAQVKAGAFGVAVPGVTDRASVLQTAIAGHEALGASRSGADLAGKSLDDIALATKLSAQRLQDVKDASQGTARQITGLQSTLSSDLQALIHATKAADVQKAATKVGEEVKRGAGGAGVTENVLAALKTQLLHTTDEKTRAVLQTEIKNVENVLPDRKFAAQEYAAVAGILKDGKITSSEQKKLNAIQQAVKDRGLPAVQKGIQDKIKEAQKAQERADTTVKAAISGVKAAVGLDTQAIKDKDLSVALTNVITVSNRDIVHQHSVFSGAGGHVIAN